MTFKDATHYYEQFRRNGLPNTLSAKQTLWDMVEAFSLRLMQEEEKNAKLNSRLDDLVNEIAEEFECECDE
jgi:hypothetical protein